MKRLKRFLEDVMGWGAAIVIGVTAAAAEAVEDLAATNRVYGTIWRKDLRITGAQLLGSCFQGYGLFGCSNRNSTSDRTGVSNQFLPSASYCLNCCGNPTATGTDETWDLVCPMTALQRSIVINDVGKRFVFARRQTVADEFLVSCEWPVRNLSLFLAGYVVDLRVSMHSDNQGWSFWVGVESCTVSAIESNVTPTTFHERIRMVSTRQSYSPSSSWFILLAGTSVALLVTAWVVYRGYVKGEHCVNCASKFVLVNSLCALCIVCGCRLHAPPPKVFCAETFEATKAMS
ncbi:hypothetical protein H310_09454 [Aphanomyces invadans]|uniref:Uncharacterized protein n=1 Tax=Aphanomyces invadans TaxID=157072 RepID=A0A024TTQ5_9STRA|nr:hypothetical protein H310_09454 [Aphanomyces invadans]ETV97540.1 hypothetical protein H310_09454 [Aphanomyces invadans]|eukprot:XP_008873749.1 hypothetical protein H310_09454 [Aphanomyces invadans]